MPAPKSALSDELAAVVRSAPFAFVGVVRRRGAATAEGDQPTAVVGIEEVIVAPPTLGDLTGQDIIVRLAQPSPPAGRRMFFFASSLVYGAELAVTELARAAPGRARASLRAQVLQERLEQYDDRLRERLRMADVVAYGRVASVEPASPEEHPDGEPPAGEAGASWRVAELLIWRILKGQPSRMPRVLFPFPRTQRWPDVPLFLEGQEGVWLLQRPGRDDIPKPPAVPGAFIALDSLDVHAAGALARIQLLLKTIEQS
jgi:hypothetical protein